MHGCPHPPQPPRKSPQVPRPPPLDAKVPLGSRTCLSQAGTRSEWDLRYTLCHGSESARGQDRMQEPHGHGCSLFQGSCCGAGRTYRQRPAFLRNLFCVVKPIGTHLEHTWNILFFHVPRPGTHWNTLGTHMEHTAFIVITNHLGLLPDRLLYYY